jgi:uncharacterized protein YqeY
MSDQTPLKERFKTDLVQAMRDKDELRRTTIRALMSAVRTAEVAGSEARELSDDEQQAVVRTEAKKRRESAELYEAAGRTEQAQRERDEEQVVLAYLPAQLGADDLAAVVDEEVAAAAAQGRTGMAAMGGVVKAVRERVGQQASGGDVAAAVRARLQG